MADLKSLNVSPEFWLNPRKSNNDTYEVHLYYYESSKGVSGEKDQNYYLIINGALSRISLSEDEYPYIGDTKPIAKGLTAFLVRHLTEEQIRSFWDNDEKDETWPKAMSVYDWLCADDISFIIFETFEEYWNRQKVKAEQQNNRLSYEQGHLNSDKFLEVFANEHVERERTLFEESQDFFNSQIHICDASVLDYIKKYIEEYFTWVATDKLNATLGYGTGFHTELSKKELESIANKIVRIKLIKPKHASAFVSLFSQVPKEVEWNDEIRGAKAALFDIMERIAGKPFGPKDLRPFFKAKSGRKIIKNWRDKDRHHHTKFGDAVMM